MTHRLIRALACFAALATSHACANTISIGALKDSTIFSNNNNASGGAEVLHVNENSSGNIRRSLIKFDIVGSVPAGATINSVTLALHVNATDSPNQTTITLARITSDWGDGTTGSGGASGGGGQGFAPANGDVTWNNRSFSTSPPTPPLLSWTTAGGDFSGTVSGSLTFTPVIGNYYSWAAAGMVNDVQQWLDQPATNFGWIIRGPENEPSTLIRFDSKERTVAEFRPVLTIDYSAVPEPGSFVLTATGLAVALVERRRQFGNMPSSVHSTERSTHKC